MRLWLLRHGEAEAHAASDAFRQLTERGRRQVREASGWLEDIPFSGVLASPYMRAQQTAALACETAGIRAEVVTVGWLLPDTDLRLALAEVSRFAEGDWLLVTHQPLVGDLASLLMHGHRGGALSMGTASLAELEGLLPLAGGMDLVSLRHPTTL